eukprot:jgi/Chrzof1/6541/Cz19g00130.t1
MAAPITAASGTHGGSQAYLSNVRVHNPHSPGTSDDAIPIAQNAVHLELLTCRHQTSVDPAYIAAALAQLCTRLQHGSAADLQTAKDLFKSLSCALLKQLQLEHRQHCSPGILADIVQSWGRLARLGLLVPNDALLACLGHMDAAVCDNTAPTKNVAQLLEGLGALAKCAVHRQRPRYYSQPLGLTTLMKGKAHVINRWLKHVAADNGHDQNMRSTLQAAQKLASAGLYEPSHAVVDQLLHALSGSVNETTRTNDIICCLYDVAGLGVRVHPAPLAKLLDVVLLRHQTGEPTTGGKAMCGMLSALSRVKTLYGLERVVPQTQWSALLNGSVACSAGEQLTLVRIASAVMAVARLPWYKQGLQQSQMWAFTAAQAITAAMVDAAQAGDIARAMWGLSKLTVLHPGALALLCEGATKRLNGMSPQQLGMVAAGIAQLGHRDEKLLTAIARQHAVRFSADELCNICLAVSLLDMPQLLPELRAMCDTVVRMWDGMTVINQRHLYQVHIWLADQGLPALLPADKLAQCRASWQDMISTNAMSSSSTMHHELCNIIKQLQQRKVMPITHITREHQTADGLFTIDVCFQLRQGDRVAVEADGPFHFSYPDGHVLPGTAFRNKALAARGYKVLCISVHDWRAIAKAQGRKGLVKLVHKKIIESIKHLAAL